MTARIAHLDPDLVASAAIEALMDARWESSDLLARRSTELAPDLLRGHAAELAASAIGRDQVLSVALDAAAIDLEEGRTPLADGALFFFQQAMPGPEDRRAVRSAVLRQGGVPVAESLRVAEEIEQRHRSQCIEVRELSERLLAEARLHELLWDDPRLPAAPRTRLVMLCAAARLMERAEELEPDQTAGTAPADDKVGHAFRRLDQRRRETERGGEWAEASRAPGAAGRNSRPTHPWSLATGWLLLLGIAAVVLIQLLGAR